MARVGKIRVSTGVLADNNAATDAPSAATNGVAVPRGRKSEFTHFIATKANIATFSLWGYQTQIAEWTELERMNFTHAGNESQLLTGVVAFDRLCEQRLDGNVANVGLNTFWGFSE